MLGVEEQLRENVVKAQKALAAAADALKNAQAMIDLKDEIIASQGAMIDTLKAWVDAKAPELPPLKVPRVLRVSGLVRF